MIKTVVIGLDGANWNLLQPWLEGGKLPNIKRLRENGCWGDMLSCLPTVTVPNWKCYSTGKNPGKLGVYRFDQIDTKNRRFVINNSSSFKSKEIWDYMNDEGLRTGIINMPTTYPPKEVKGFIIAGGPDACEDESRSNDLDYVSPSCLQRDLRERWNYKVHPEPMISSREGSGKAIDAILDLLRLRFKVGWYLLEKEHLDFLQITLFYHQALQHFFWRDEPVFRAWQIIDREIGEFLNKDFNLILISDHGIQKVNTNFFLNTWLEQKGYLVTRKKVDDWLYVAGINRQNLLKFFNKLHLTTFLQKVVPQSLQRLIPWQEGVRKARTFDKVDWDKTRAIGSVLGPIFLNVDEGCSEYKKLRDELIEELGALKSPFSGEKVMAKVYRREEIYHGDYLQSAPDLVALQNDGVHISDALGRKTVFSREGKWAAENIRRGMFLFFGPEIKKGVEVPPIDITDVAPTILHLMKTPVPSDMDGRVLSVIFKEDSQAANREVVYQDVEKFSPLDVDETEGREVEERLRSLGYLD